MIASKHPAVLGALALHFGKGGTTVEGEVFTSHVITTGLC